MVDRLFLAVALTAEARARLTFLIDQFGGGPLPGNPVPPPNWHLTLRFLGATDEIRYDRVLAALDQIELGKRFPLTLSGLGAFPHGRRASVLWVAVKGGADRMDSLAKVVEEAVQQVGFEPEDRPFRPHLTLSRLRPHQDLQPLLDRPAPAPVRFPVEAVTLYRSRQGVPGTSYEPREEFPLG